MGNSRILMTYIPYKAEHLHLVQWNSTTCLPLTIHRFGGGSLSLRLRRFLTIKLLASSPLNVSIINRKNILASPSSIVFMHGGWSGQVEWVLRIEKCQLTIYTGALRHDTKNGCVANYISFDVCLLNRGRESKLTRSTIEDILGMSCVLWYRPLAMSLGPVYMEWGTPV